MKILNLPFVWRLLDEPTSARTHTGANGEEWKFSRDYRHDIPTRMDFEFDWDPALGLLRQRITPFLEEALAKIYAAGSSNLGATSNFHDRFRSYVDYLIPEIGARLFDRPSAFTLLDIGGGRRSVLEGMHGFDVYTLDPSADDRADPLRLFSATFPCAMRSGWPEKFDVITLNHVLEHVEDPLAVLKAAAALLARGGAIITAVPDCSESVRLGDISMACHQHLSYFTAASLRACFRAADLFDRTHEQSGTLFSIAYPNGVPIAHREPEESFGRFLARAFYNQRYIGDFIQAMGMYEGDTAIAVPMRGLPYVPGWRGPVLDDGMSGKYLDGVPTRISAVTPLDPSIRNVFVMSLTHEKAIAEKLGDRKVITLRELLDG